MEPQITEQLAMDIYSLIYEIGCTIGMWIGISRLPNVIQRASMTDYQLIYGITLQQLSYAYAINNFMSMLGSMGLVSSYVNKQLVCMVSLVVYGTCSALFASLPAYGWLMAMMSVSGLFYEGFYLMKNLWLIQMWSKQCGQYLQALNFADSMASIVGPLMVRPFLSNTIQNDTHIDHRVGTESQLYIPTIITGSLTVGCGIYLGIFYFVKRYEPRPVESNQNNFKPFLKKLLNRLRIELAPNVYQFIQLLLCSTILALFYVFQSPQYYLSTFAQLSQLHMSQQSAAYLVSGFSIASAVSQLVCIFVIKYLNVNIIMYTCLALIVIAQLLYLFFANHLLSVMWTATILFGIGFGPLIGCILNYMEILFPVTDMVGMFYSLYDMDVDSTLWSNKSLSITE
ncbi:uncharacterized protein LOC128964978 [Oppia nitens]|uniref:uncharacterized protein LOC128964978 n=1 Tax=Oppia nitens TaxID=1686743 RepID=UPI0023DAEF28|nr:uncharacterized protein LOC128964978 [Oppia nitens]